MQDEESSSAPGDRRLDAERWLDDHGDALYRHARFRLRHDHDAEDVVQETLLAALRSRDSYSGAASERTWLVGILQHKIVDRLRRRWRESVPAEELNAESALPAFFARSGHLAEADATWGDDPSRLLERAEFRRQLQECVDALPTRAREIFVRREADEASTEELCREAAISESNLWVLLHRARLQLRLCLERHWFAGEKA